MNWQDIEGSFRWRWGQGEVVRCSPPDSRFVSYSRCWVREILGLLHIVHNRRLLGMLASFRRNAAVDVRTCVLPTTAWLLAN